MNIRTLAVCAVLAASSLAHAQLHTDSFTYQGTIMDEGVPANGMYDISFIVYDSAVGGNIVPSGARFVGGIEVVDGVFEAFVDFTSSGSVFDSDQTRWLQLNVRETGNPNFNALSPRQRMAPTPLANYALRSGTTLQQAYENGSTIFRGASDPAFAIRSTSANQAQLILGNQSGTESAGRFFMYTDGGGLMQRVETDISVGGGTFFSLARNDNGSNGLIYDGNKDNTQSPEVTIFGQNSIILSTQLTGDATVKLPNDAINSAEILNEVGASEFESFTTRTLTNVDAVIDAVASVTIDCPTSGFVLVLSSSELAISHVTGTTSSVVLGVSQIMTSLPNNGDLETRIISAETTGIYDHAVSTHGLFPVSAGSSTFYLLGDKNNTTGFAQVLDTQLTAVFIPTNYGSISRQPGQDIPDEFTPISDPMSELDILREQDEAHRANIARQQLEIDAMKAQMQELIKRANQTLEQQSQD